MFADFDFLDTIVKMALEPGLKQLLKWSGSLFKAKPADLKKKAEEVLSLPNHAEKITAAVAEKAGKKGSAKELHDATEAVNAALTALADGSAQDPDSFITTILAHKRATYVIWLSYGTLGEEGVGGRYVHFSWAEEGGFRVRDYLGNQVFYRTAGSSRVGDEGDLKAVEWNWTAEQVWLMSHGQIQSVAEYGLGFAITEVERWKKVLSLLTEAASFHWPAPETSLIA